ncbi:hypothetical protein SLOPH_1804 [Spraguea lophii 42_110]|uniref:Uncharacterized protein n=1 Tax=Spraguea lophii (strain 42_110) TaxID=1358809 RepID=S7WAV2_SPRLO|nr:hypothetical protein SLOPH_1804 [Spraguea lophii 42_110]
MINADRELARSLSKYCISHVYTLYKHSLEQNGISYIPYLVPMEKIIKNEEMGCCQSANTILKNMGLSYRVQMVYIKKYDGLSTIDLLQYVDHLFMASKKSIRKKKREVRIIKNILMDRDNLVYDSLNFLSLTRRTFHPERCYYVPGMKNSDIFSFIVSMTTVKKLITCYKNLVVENILKRLPYPFGVDRILKSRVSTFQLSDMDVIKTDGEILKELSNGIIIKPIKNTLSCCISTNTYSFKPSNDIKIHKKIISHPNWCINHIECNNTYTFDIFIMLRIKISIQPNEFMNYFILNNHSYLEIEIDDKTEIVSFVEFYMLLTKNKEYEDYWKNKGVGYDEYLDIV